MAERSHAFLVRGETGRGEEVNLSDLTDDQLWAIVDNPGIICRVIEGEIPTYPVFVTR